jgi:hypothetical protein
MSKIVVEYITLHQEGEQDEDANQRINANIESFVAKYGSTHAINGPTVMGTQPPTIEMRAVELEFRLEAMKRDGRDAVKVQYEQKLEADALQSGVQAASAASVPPARAGGFPAPRKLHG